MQRYYTVTTRLEWIVITITNLVVITILIYGRYQRNQSDQHCWLSA